MNGFCCIALFPLIVMAVLYELEHRWPFTVRRFAANLTSVAASGLASARGPFISVVSGFAEEELRRRCMRRGRDDHV